MTLALKIPMVLAGAFLVWRLADYAIAADRYMEPERVQVVKVIDGDTVDVTGYRVRIAGIDTPEKGGKAKCEAERAAAANAADFLRGLIQDRDVVLTGIVNYKFGGRVRATVMLGNLNVGAELIRAGHARAYAGEKRQGWCP